MKATFFSLAGLAASAFAAPAVEQKAPAARQVGQVGDAVQNIDDVVTEELGIGEIIDGATGGNSGSTPSNTTEKPLESAGDLIELLEGLLESLLGDTADINDTLSAFSNGDISQSQADAQASASLSDLDLRLAEIITDLTNAAGLDVQGSDVDRVLSLVTILLSEVLATVNGLVTILGIRPQLASILNSVFNLLTAVLTLLIALVPGLVGGLVAGLSPLLAGLGNGLLAPILTPVAGLLAGLTGP